MDVSGIIVSRHDGPKGERLVIAPTRIGELEEIPKRIRVSWRGAASVAMPGDEVELLAILNRPPGPSAPGDYDFGRQLFFEQIGGVGYALSRPQITTKHDVAPRFTLKLERLRGRLAKRVLAGAGRYKQAGAVCAAIITGKRDGVDEATQDALRASGLAHLLAISGLHMGLVAGLLFFSVRLGFASIERIALHYPIKKWSALTALFGISFYLLISGASWSARRAFIMAAIMFFAILVDRRALSLRNVALAAILILITTPEALLHVGFQLSFAAVTVLIAAIECNDRSPNALHWRFAYGRFAPMWKYLTGLFSTSLLAGIATAPLALFHFNRMASWGLAANLIAMPLVGFWIMPMAVIGVLLMPLGLDWIAWRAMAIGMEGVLNIAYWTQSLPASVIAAKGFSLPMLLGLVFGGLWLCLNRARWRWIGLGMLPLAYISAALSSVPDVYITERARNVAVKMASDDGPQIVLLKRMGDRFAIGSWLEAAGRFPDLKTTPRLGERRKDGPQFGRCDRLGCTAELASGGILAVSFSPTGFAQDCANADILVLQYNVPAWKARICKGEIITRRDLVQTGATSLRIAQGQIYAIATVHQQRGNRIWSRGELKK